MIKCKVIGDGLNDDLSQKITSSAMKLVNRESVGLSEFRRGMRNYNHGLKNLTAITKNLSVQVDTISQISNAIKTLSFINTGISLANLAVDVAGFIMINNKLNALDLTMQTVTNELRKLSDIAKNEKISAFQELIMTYNSLSSRIMTAEDVDIKEIDRLLIKMRVFISEMFRNLQDNALEKELVLEIIFVLMPAYTQLLNELVKRTYWERQSLPANYHNYVSLYEELENTDFRDSLIDHFFLHKKMHSQDVIDLVNTQSLLVINQKVLIEDQASMLKMLGTREKYDAFEMELDDFIKSMVQEKIPQIAKEVGVSNEECKKYFAFENQGI